MAEQLPDAERRTRAILIEHLNAYLPYQFTQHNEDEE